MQGQVESGIPKVQCYSGFLPRRLRNAAFYVNTECTYAAEDAWVAGDLHRDCYIFSRGHQELQVDHFAGVGYALRRSEVHARHDDIQDHQLFFCYLLEPVS